MRPRSLLLVTTALALTACSGGEGGSSAGATTAPAHPATTTATTTAGAAAAAAHPPGPAPEHVTDLAGGVRRFGDGRALFASYDPRTDRLVVATTIGVDVQQGDGEPVVISPEMATLFAASADGRLVAAVTSAGHLTIWDVGSRKSVATFDVQAGDDTVLTFAGPQTVLLSDATSVVRYSIDGTTAPVVAAPSGTQLGPVTVDDGGSVAVPVLTATPSVATWSATAGPGRIGLGLPAGTRLTGVVLSGDGAHLAVLDAPPTAGDQMAVWDVAAGRFAGAPVDLPNYVTPAQLAFPTPDRVVLPRGDQVVAFDLAGKQVASFPIGPSAVSRVVAAAGAAVVSRLDGTVTRWPVDTDPSDLGPRTVTLVDLRGGAATTTVDQNGLVRAYRADGRTAHDLPRWAVGEATSVDLTADGSQLAIATTTGAVRLLDAATGTVAAILDRPQGDVSDVSFAPDDTVVATGIAVQKRAQAWDDTIEATRLSSGAQLVKIGGQSEDVAGCSFYEGHVEFSPDGKLLASSSHDFTVQVTPLGDPGATKVLKPHLGTVLDLHFSPDGSRLVTAADDGSMRVWQVDGWKLLGEHRSLPGGYFSLAFSPDGSKLAVSGATGQISLVDATTGTAVATFTGTREQLGDMTFTPDGSRLLAPLPNGAVGVWSVASGRIVRQLTGHTMPVSGIAIARDGTRVVTASQDGTVRSWPLPAA